MTSASSKRRNASPRQRAARHGLVVLGALLGSLALPAAALADNVYWSDSGAAQLRYGSLAGGAASTLFAAGAQPGALALNPSAGTVYWTDAATGNIEVGDLDGSGVPQTLYSEPGAAPTGIAIDAATGKLYWTDEATGQIRGGSIAGASAEAASTLYTEPEGAKPVGLTLSSGSGTLYWADEVFTGEGPGAIRSGSVAGSGTAAGSTVYTEPEGARPVDVAIDSSSKTLYWTDEGSGEVRYGPLGGGTAQTRREEPAGAMPRGIALDTDNGQLYWADAGTGTIQFGPIAGGAAPGSVFGGESGPSFPTLLLAPSGTGAPKIAGHYAVGQTLTCGTGSWAGNSPGANLYGSPTSYSYAWQLNGTTIAGATAASYAPTVEGKYSCLVTAGNAAGSAAQSSAQANVKAQPPSASIAFPANGAVIEKGQVVSTSFSCAEGAGGPGLASCTDGKHTSAPTGRLNTSHLGTHRYVVTAVSKDGQRASATVTVTIVPKRPVVKPTPPPRPTPRIAIASDKATVNGRRLRIALVCHVAACRGKLSLSARVSGQTLARVKRGRGARGPRHSVLVLVARTAYSLAPGEHRAIVVRIRRLARKLLLNANAHRLVVRTSVTVKGGAAKHRGVVLRLRRGRG